MIRLILLGLLLGFGVAGAATQTINIQAQVTTTATGTTISIPAQTATVPLSTTTPPPTCGAAPSSSSATIACPTGTTGSWTQTKTYTAAAAPTCWTPVLTPTAAPAGACTTVVTPPPPPPPPVTNNCGNVLGGAVTFCETFDAPAGLAGARSGDLNANVWGASRSQGTNFGQSWYNIWNPTAIKKCDGTAPTVLPPNDIIICNGQLREASNDNNDGGFDDGDVTSLAMYPKQPFDFAGRTGTVSFDVSNDSYGGHSVWPEFWMSDAPVPDPFSFQSSWFSVPANGFGVHFANIVSPGQQGECPNAKNLSSFRWTVDIAFVVRNYVEEGISADKQEQYGTASGLTVTDLDCVISSSGPGNMNHVELRIAASEIDVYATDAGVAASQNSLREIAKITGTRLSFTRGLVWLEDAHYNADKEVSLLAGASPPTTIISQRQHTFSWDNLAFDGPFTARDFAFDAPDNTLPVSNGALSLGQFSAANQTSTWKVPGIPANPNPAAVKVLFNFNGGSGPTPTVLNVIVNGHAHQAPWPYPDQDTASTRTLAVTIPVTDLIAGTNVVQLGADQAEAFFNVDIVLGAVPGGVAVLPGSNQKYPGT